MSEKTLVLVDGENLVFRFESLCNQGKKPRDGVKHKVGGDVGHGGISSMWASSILRVSYYTTFVGDDQAQADIYNELSNISYPYIRPETLNARATINPRIFKRSKRSSKTIKC